MSFAPPGENASDLWFERSNFAGCLLGGVAYGMHVCVFAIAMYLMTHPKSKKRSSKLSIAFICTLFILGTIQLGTNSKYYEMMWIDDRNFPGGPIAFFTTQFSVPINTVGGAAFLLADFLADSALKIYRLFVICNSSYLIIVLPVLALLASTALNILTVFQYAQPGASLWSHTTIQFALPFWSFSIGLNMFMSLAIAFRLMQMRRSLTFAIGVEHAKMYTSIASMIVESAALYSVTGMVYLICYARGTNVQNLIISALDQIICIAPELIALRVSLGHSWTRDTTRRVMSSVHVQHVPTTTIGEMQFSGNMSGTLAGPLSTRSSKSDISKAGFQVDDHHLKQVDSV